MAYGEPRSPTGAPLFQIRVGEEKPYQFGVNSTTSRTANTASSHNYLASLFDIGIFKDTLAPSLALHSSLAVLAWAAGRATDRVEAKDWLWPSGLVLNAWWSSIGRKVLLEGWSVSRALRLLSWPERLLLTGVTAWGLRLFYRVSSRSVRRGKDDARYESSKKQEGFWNKALVGMFLPEAVFQSVIALPFTAPFRHQGAVLTGYHPYVQMLAVGVFSAGFALEALADYQLEEHRGSAGLMRKGVWSIVRHPNYLGDTLVHAAFPLLLYASDMLAPIELLGPIANYIFLRYVGGDKENEASQGQQYAKEDSNKNVRTKDKDLLADGTNLPFSSVVLSRSAAAFGTGAVVLIDSAASPTILETQIPVGEGQTSSAVVFEYGTLSQGQETTINRNTHSVDPSGLVVDGTSIVTFSAIAIISRASTASEPILSINPLQSLTVIETQRPIGNGKSTEALVLGGTTSHVDQPLTTAGDIISIAPSALAVDGTHVGPLSDVTKPTQAGKILGGVTLQPGEIITTAGVTISIASSALVIDSTRTVSLSAITLPLTSADPLTTMTTASRGFPSVAAPVTLTAVETETTSPRGRSSDAILLGGITLLTNAALTTHSETYIVSSTMILVSGIGTLPSPTSSVPASITSSGGHPNASAMSTSQKGAASSSSRRSRATTWMYMYVSAGLASTSFWGFLFIG